METSDIMNLCDQIRETAYEIHRYHGTGYLEKVYENALAHRLRKKGMDVKQQHQIIVHDEDGTEIGEYYADLFVENSLIIELKTCKEICENHKAQLLNYLKGSKLEHGLLINFGAEKFYIKKFIKSRSSKRASKLTSLLLPIFAFLAFFRG
ncbi:MAG: GxxExxY protein [Lentisphaerae bacterium]|jgi:GxxExxY protein|nr:GxxExxY protein [Lentisphaerota bacterium]